MRRGRLIHERDIADVAVVALLEPGHVGQAHTLTGPQTLSQTEQVRLVAAAIGIPLEVEERSREAERADKLASWGDPVLVDGALDYWAGLVDAPEEVSDAVERITGHPGRTLREWAEDHVADFAPLSTAEVAQRYVAAFRSGRVADALALLAADVVRVAPMETDGLPVPVHGVAAIMEASQQLDQDLDLLGVEVLGPFVSCDQFVVRFTFDEMHLPTADRRTTTKMSLYTVRNARVSREEVYYLSRSGT
ncbi:hypothetical protein BH24ACT9_BH24ACT9_05180 [soil metagenome]